MPFVRTTLLPSALALFTLQLAPPAAGPSATLPTEVRWSVPVGARPAFSPVLAGPLVFLPLQSGAVAAHRVSDGSEAWRTGLRTDQALAVDAGRVFVASGEAIHALSADAAAVLWRAPTGTLTAPMLAKDGWLMAVSGNSLSAFRSADGSKVWSRDVGAPAARPTIEGDILYAPLADGRLVAMDLGTGATRWERRLATSGGPGGTAISEVLAFPDRVFAGAGDGRFYCLDAADGTLVWRFRIGAVLRGRPVSDGTRVYVTAMDNVVRAFDRLSGALLWHPGLPFRPGGPVLVDGAVLVPGTASEIRAFDPAGRPAGTITLEASLVVPPAFDQTPGGTVAALVTGSLTGEWKLVLMEQARGVPVAPLTVMPGTVVPVGLPDPKG